MLPQIKFKYVFLNIFLITLQIGRTQFKSQCVSAAGTNRCWRACEQKVRINYEKS